MVVKTVMSQKQQYLSGQPSKNVSQNNSSNTKKQTTTKKSRYDDSYLSENTTPTKLNNQIQLKTSNFEIPEEVGEKSSSSQSQAARIQLRQSSQRAQQLTAQQQQQQYRTMHENRVLIDLEHDLQGPVYETAGLRESINSTSTLGGRQ